MWIVMVQKKKGKSETKIMLLDDPSFNLFCKKLKDMDNTRRILIEKQNESIEDLKKLYSKAEVIIEHKH